jgi:hypothetical protein
MLTCYLKKKEEGNILEVNLFDLHLGKLCWKGETGYDYDSHMAYDRFMYALKQLVHRATSEGFSKVIFPIGNDFFNSDTIWNETTAGTRQSEDSRWQKTFQKGTQLLVEGIDYMRGFADVHALIIPGNHDEQRSFFVGETLAAYYRKAPNVVIDNSPAPRKYMEFGNVLLGWTHGDKEKSESLRSLMAGEAKQAWGRTMYREFHCGHWHRKLTKKTVTLAKMPLVDEELAMTVRHMGSLSGTDAWHFKHGYIGPTKSSQSLLWSPEHGLMAEYNVNINLESPRHKGRDY